MKPSQRVKVRMMMCLMLFVACSAGSSIGVLAAGLSAQGTKAHNEPGEILKPASDAAAIPASSGVAKRRWIDPGIAAWAPGPWRKVHIEYHTSRHMPRLAERFDADEFGDRLLAAHVNGATVFAKDMYGYSYFPSTHGRMHPNLSFDLLGAQMAALRKRKIQVLAYYMLTWNPELADRHPERLVVHEPGARPKEASEEQKAFANTLKPDGAKPAEPPGEEKGYRPYLWQFCIAQEAFVQGELDLIEELVSKYELDGVWLDGGSSPPCYCPECVRQLQAKGLDPFNAGVQYAHKWELCLSFLERIGKVVKKARPGCLVCPQNQGFWIYRQAFQRVLSEVLLIPLLQSDAHLSTELSLTHQAPKPGRKERYLVHMVNYSPVRKSPKHTDFYDDPVPLSNVTIRLNLPLKVTVAKALYAGQELPVRRDAGGGVAVLVPRVNIHEVVCFELS